MQKCIVSAHLKYQNWSSTQRIIEFESFLSDSQDMLSSVLFSKSKFTVIIDDLMPDHQHGGQTKLLTIISP